METNGTPPSARRMWHERAAHACELAADTPFEHRGVVLGTEVVVHGAQIILPHRISSPCVRITVARSDRPSKGSMKIARSKQESTATIRLVNLVRKRDSVFSASFPRLGPVANPFWREKAGFAHPLCLRLRRVRV
jgi:hypothetical protein